jgi:hypothetical protein
VRAHRGFMTIHRFALALALTSSLARSAVANPDPMLSINTADFHWKAKDALPPGAFGAVLRGDPTKGNYDFVAKFPDKFTVPMHSHTNEMVVLMLDGTMVIGRANQPDVSIAKDGLFVLPAKMAYTAHCEAACMFLVHGEKAFDIVYSNPKDDPRKKK